MREPDIPVRIILAILPVINLPDEEIIGVVRRITGNTIPVIAFVDRTQEEYAYASELLNSGFFRVFNYQFRPNQLKDILDNVRACVSS